MAQLNFQKIALFGGAMSTSMPDKLLRYKLYSNIRQVPDNQEVYLKKNGLTSITFDILERVKQFNTDQEAMRFHLEDIVAGDDTIMVPDNTVSMPSLPTHIPVTSTFARVHAQVNEKGEKIFTAIILMLIRLEKEETDIVITINVPNVPDEYEPRFMTNMDPKEYDAKWAGTDIEEALEMKNATSLNFKINDFSLFRN